MLEMLGQAENQGFPEGAYYESGMLPVGRKLTHEAQISFEVLGRLFPNHWIIVMLR